MPLYHTSYNRGVRNATVGDLELILASCRRMLHAKFDGQFYYLRAIRKATPQVIKKACDNQQ